MGKIFCVMGNVQSPPGTAHGILIFFSRDTRRADVGADLRVCPTQTQTQAQTQLRPYQKRRASILPS